jgi:DNA-binding transcriptional LysR family regulator
MSVLLAAAESGSLSKASRNLRLPLATVSRKVAELEAHLNATLLIRSARGLELTPAGRSYVTAAKAILEQVTEAERAAAGEYTEPKGDLVVTAPIMFGRMHVLPVVTRFLAAYPEVSVGLVMTDRVAHFLDDQVDVALRIGPLPDSSLIATRLGTVRHVICASPDYLAANGIPSTPDDLARHSVISFSKHLRVEFLGLRIRRHRDRHLFPLPPGREHDRCGDRRRPLRIRVGPRGVLPDR